MNRLYYVTKSGNSESIITRAIMCQHHANLDKLSSKSSYISYKICLLIFMPILPIIHHLFNSPLSYHLSISFSSLFQYARSNNVIFCSFLANCLLSFTVQFIHCSFLYFSISIGRETQQGIKPYR